MLEFTVDIYNNYILWDKKRSKEKLRNCDRVR